MAGKEKGIQRRLQGRWWLKSKKKPTGNGDKKDLDVAGDICGAQGKIKVKQQILKLAEI